MGNKPCCNKENEKVLDAQVSIKLKYSEHSKKVSSKSRKKIVLSSNNNRNSYISIRDNTRQTTKGNY